MYVEGYVSTHLHMGAPWASILSSLVVKPGGTPLKIRVRIMIPAVRIMISAVRKIQGRKMIQNQKVQKLTQTQRLKRELLEYEPVRG